MAKISTFFYAESVTPETTAEGMKMHVLSPLNVLLPDFVPGQFSFSVVIGLLDYDFTGKHTLKIMFSDECGKLNIKAENVATAINPHPHIAPERLGVMANIDFRNVIFESEGIYKTDVFLDDINLGTYPIEVIRKRA